MNKVAVINNTFDVNDLEVATLEYEQAECPVIHRFSPGLYIRELHMKAGIFAVGHYQRYEHFNLFLKGKVLSKDKENNNIELVAPMTFTAPPGRKFGLILEDVVWLNVYPTDETDVETLEEMFFDKSTVWKESKRLFDLNKPKQIIDNKDYQQLLVDYNFNENEIKKLIDNKEDQIPLPFGDYKVFVSNSIINGKGIFASAYIYDGEIIGLASSSGKRTPLGRYTNHSITPNARMLRFKDSDDIYLMATTNILGCCGGLPGEEVTTNYRKTLKLLGVQKCVE